LHILIFCVYNDRPNYTTLFSTKVLENTIKILRANIFLQRPNCFFLKRVFRSTINVINVIIIIIIIMNWSQCTRSLLLQYYSVQNDNNNNNNNNVPFSVKRGGEEVLRIDRKDIKLFSKYLGIKRFSTADGFVEGWPRRSYLIADLELNKGWKSDVYTVCLTTRVSGVVVYARTSAVRQNTWDFGIFASAGFPVLSRPTADRGRRYTVCVTPNGRWPGRGWSRAKVITRTRILSEDTQRYLSNKTCDEKKSWYIIIFSSGLGCSAVYGVQAPAS